MMEIRGCAYCGRDVGGDNAWVCGVCGVSWVKGEEGIEMQVIRGYSEGMIDSSWLDVPFGCLLVVKEEEL